MQCDIHVKGEVTLCGRCRKKVFFNEEKRVDGIAWHLACFTCANHKCKRPLDSRNVTFHNDEIYCHLCYPKLFGPSGFGVGVPPALTTEKGWRYSSSTAEWIIPSIPRAYIGPQLSSEKIQMPKVKVPPARTTTSTSSLALQNLNGKQGDCRQTCEFCEKEICKTEKVLFEGKAWHDSCFACRGCKKALNSFTFKPNSGQLFCANCSRNITFNGRE